MVSEIEQGRLALLALLQPEADKYGDDLEVDHYRGEDSVRILLHGISSLQNEWMFDLDMLSFADAIQIAREKLSKINF